MNTSPRHTSPQRILTTHVGSLPRPEHVVTQLFAQDSGLNYVEVGYWDAWKKMFQNLNDVGIHYYKHGVVASESTPPSSGKPEEEEDSKEEDVVDVDVDDCDDKIKLD